MKKRLILLALAGVGLQILGEVKVERFTVNLSDPGYRETSYARRRPDAGTYVFYNGAAPGTGAKYSGLAKLGVNFQPVFFGAGGDGFIRYQYKNLPTTAKRLDFYDPINQVVLSGTALIDPATNVAVIAAVDGGTGAVNWEFAPPVADTIAADVKIDQRNGNSFLLAQKIDGTELFIYALGAVSGQPLPDFGQRGLFTVKSDIKKETRPTMRISGDRIYFAYVKPNLDGRDTVVRHAIDLPTGNTIAMLDEPLGSLNKITNAGLAKGGGIYITGSGTDPFNKQLYVNGKYSEDFFTLVPSYAHGGFAQIPSRSPDAIFIDNMASGDLEAVSNTVDGISYLKVDEAGNPAVDAGPGGQAIISGLATAAAIDIGSTELVTGRIIAGTTKGQTPLMTIFRLTFSSSQKSPIAEAIFQKYCNK